MMWEHTKLKPETGKAKVRVSQKLFPFLTLAVLPYKRSLWAEKLGGFICSTYKPMLIQSTELSNPNLAVKDRILNGLFFAIQPTCLYCVSV